MVLDGLQIERGGAFVDAYDGMGVSMGDGFLDALLAPCPVKPLVENRSRLQDGKRVVIDDSKLFLESRDLTLTFNIEGTSPADYVAHREAFYNLLYGRKVTIRFAEVNGRRASTDTFRLLYTGQSVSYAQTIDGCASKVTAKFEEPNPKDRS